MFASPLFAALLAVLLWLWSTGAILLAVRCSDGAAARLGAVIWGLPCLAFGWVAAAISISDTGLGGIYLGFVAALAIWGWIELAFLTGIITGPNQHPLPPGVSAGHRFARAFGTVAWHEAALLVALLVLYGMVATAANAMVFYTYAILYGARVLAKLNIFLGVPGINTEAVPRHLHHLLSYFRQSDPSWFFPLSVTLLSLLTGLLFERLLTAADPLAQVSFALLAMLSALALLEHWMMLIPLADARLWRWMAPKITNTTAPDGRTTTGTAR